MNYKITDCTLRDGGYYTNWDFDQKIVEQYFDAITASPIDMIEVGYISPPAKAYQGCYFYLPDQTLRYIQASTKGKKLAVMVNTKEITIQTLKPILKRVAGYIDIIRFATSLAVIPHALDCVKIAKEMGFKTTLNIMHLSSSENIEKLWTIIEEHKERINTVDIVYLVDSYGGLYPDQVTNLVSHIKTQISCKIGLHGHNNLELAFANTLAAADVGIDYIDTTLAGIGRGAGNLRTELLLTHINRAHGFHVDLSAIARIAEKFEYIRVQKEARNNMAYTISGAFGLPQADVMKWLSIQRYTVDSVVAMLTQNSKSTDSCISFSPSKLNLPHSDKTLIVGGGSSTSEHLSAIIEFVKQHPNLVIIHSSARWLVREINEWKALPNPQIMCLAGDEAYKLKHTYNSPDLAWLCCMIGSNTLVPLHKILCGTPCYTLTSTQYTHVNADSPAPLSLAVAKILSLNNIYLVGFDGYAKTESMLTVQTETQQAFDASIANGVLPTTLIPSHYKNISVESVYSLI